MDIQLRPIRLEDSDVVLEWSRNAVFCVANGWEIGRSAEDVDAWWHRCVRNVGQHSIRLGIEYEGRLVGYVDLPNIQGDTAELGIAIGETSLWGRGLGAQAVRALMTYAATELGLTVLKAETHETNCRSRRLLESLGFHEVSRIGSEEYSGTECPLVQYQRPLKTMKC